MIINQFKKTRCKFNSMNDFYIESIGFQRAKVVIGLINLV